MAQLITNLIILFLILVFVGAVWFLWLEISRQQRRKSRKKGAIVLRGKPKHQQSNRGRDSAVKKQLIRLLHGDRQAVERLIDSAKFKQAGRSERWYEEKVLQDLERDRR